MLLLNCPNVLNVYTKVNPTLNMNFGWYWYTHVGPLILTSVPGLWEAFGGESMCMGAGGVLEL